MTSKRWASAILGVGLAAVQAAVGGPKSAELPGLTLDQAVQAALANHPVLRQAEVDIRAAETRVKRARSNRLPQIDAGGLAMVGLPGSASLLELHGLASSPEPKGLAASVNVLQELLDFGRSKTESQARRAEVDYFSQTLVAQKRNIALEVSKAYYEGLKAAGLIELAQTRVWERTLAAQWAEVLHSARLGPKLDADSAGVRLVRARLAVKEGKASLRQAFAALNAAMGEEPKRAYALRDPEIRAGVPEPLAALLVEAVDNRPELAAVNARIQAGKEWVRRAKRERYPRIRAMFSGGWIRIAELTLSRLVFAGLGIQLPLLTGGRLQANIEETRLGLERTEAARDDLKRAVCRQVAEAHSRLRAARAALKTAKQGVAEARGAARLARVRAKQGLEARLAWQGARVGLAGAENERDQALYDVGVAQMELDFAVGRSRGASSERSRKTLKKAQRKDSKTPCQVSS